MENVSEKKSTKIQMNQEEKHQEETRRDALLSYSVRRGFRSRFISLVVEQIRRFQARTFEESHSSAETKQAQFKRPTTSVTLYLKLYAGQINSILIFFHDLITSEELRTMASYWHEIISKCRDLETELSRYSKSILQSDLESSNQNVKLTEEELKQLLDFINNFPAMLLSQGDSQQSIIDTVNKIQEKIQDILGHSKKTGVLQAELLFVGDMKNILNTVQSLSQTAVDQQGFNTPLIERPALSTEVNHAIQDTFYESVDENEVLDTGTHRSKDSFKMKDEEKAYHMENKSKRSTIVNTLKPNLIQESKRSTDPSSRENRDNVSKPAPYSTHGQVKNSLKLFSSEQREEKDSRSESSKRLPKKEINLVILNEKESQVGSENSNGESLQNTHANERPLLKEDGFELHSSTVDVKESLRNEAYSTVTDHRQKDYVENQVMKTPSLYDEIVEAGEVDFVKPGKRKSEVGDTFAYDDNDVDATTMERVTPRREIRDNEMSKKKEVDRELEFRRLHENTIENCKGESFKDESLTETNFSKEECSEIPCYSNSRSSESEVELAELNTQLYSKDSIPEDYWDRVRMEHTPEKYSDIEGDREISSYSNSLECTSEVDLSELNTHYYSKDDIPEDYWDRVIKEDILQEYSDKADSKEISSYSNSLSGTSDVNLTKLNTQYYSKDDISEDYWDRVKEEHTVEDKSDENEIASYSNSLESTSEVDIAELNTQYYSKDDIPEDYWDRVKEGPIIEDYPDKLDENEIASYSNSLESTSEVDIAELNTQYYSTDDIPEDYWDRVKEGPILEDYPDKLDENEIASYSNSLESTSEVDITELNTQYYSKDDIPEEYWDRVNEEPILEDYPHRTYDNEIISYSNSLESTSEKDITELNTQYYSKDDIPEDYWDRVKEEHILEDYPDKSDDNEIISYSNSLESTSEVNIAELNTQYYSKDDIPEDYWDRKMLALDIDYLNDLDECYGADLNELNTHFYSKDDIPEEYCDRVKSPAEVCYSGDLDDFSEVDMDELNHQFYSVCDIPDEYCDRAQPSEDFYSNDLDDNPNVSLSELNTQYYSKHGIPEEFCDRVQNDLMYSNDLDEKPEDTLNDFNTKFYSSYDIPEDACDRDSDLLNVILDLKFEYPSKRLETQHLSTTEIMKEDAGGTLVLNAASSKETQNILHRETLEKMKYRKERDDKDDEAERCIDVLVNPDLEDVAAVYDNEINDEDTDDLLTLNELYYSKDDIPEDYEDRREIQKQKQQSSLEFAKSVIEQIKSSSDGKIVNDSTAPFKSLVDLYSSVVEIKNILRTKGRDVGRGKNDYKEMNVTEKQDVNVEDLPNLSIKSSSVCESKVIDELDVKEGNSKAECPVDSSSVESIEDKGFYLSENTSCSSSKSNFFPVDSDIFFSAITLRKSVSSATSSDSTSGNYMVRASSEFCFDNDEYYVAPEHKLEWDETKKYEGITTHLIGKSNMQSFIISPHNSKSVRHISNSLHRISPRLSVSDSCLSKKSQESVETQTCKGNSPDCFTMNRCKRISIGLLTIILFMWAFVFCLTLFGMCFEWPPRYCMDLHKMIHLRHIGPPVI